MVTATHSTTVHVPTLAAEVPSGWRVADVMVLSTPSGYEVEVYAGPAEFQSAAALVDAEVDRARAILDTVQVGDPTERQLPGGHLAVTRELRVVDGEANDVIRVAGVVAQGEGIRFVSRARDGDARASADFVLALDAVFLRSPTSALARAEHRDVSDASPGGPPARSARPLLDPHAWRDVVGRWARGPAQGSPPTCSDVASWSELELLVAATLHGTDAFPTVDGEALVNTPRLVNGAVADAVITSLRARGLVGPDSVGRLVPTGMLAGIVDLATAPDLVVWIERGEGDGLRGWWFGVRTDAALQLSVGVDGARDTARLDPHDVVDHVLALVAAAPGLSTITVLWHADTRVEGGTFAWSVSPDGAVSAGDELVPDDAGGSTWRLRDAEIGALRSLLLGYLPAAWTSEFSGSEVG